MRLCTFRDAGGTRLGARRGRRRPAARGPATCATPSTTRPGRGGRAAGPPGEAWSCSPPLPPGKLLGIGLNYRDHAAETGAELPSQPLLFAKLVSSVTGPSGEVVRPAYTDELDYEGELAVVIGRTAPRRAGRGRRPGPRLRLRGDERRDRPRPPARRAPVDPRQGRRRLRPVRPLDHDRRRGARPPGAVHPHLGQRRSAPGRHHRATWSSRSPTSSPSARPASPCEPGDVITTGTPAGVGVARDPKAFLQPGDRVRVEIPELGVLEHAIR